MAINQMPHNLDAEKALLGCILLDENVQAEILDDLKADDFYQESHREILLGMKAVHAMGKAVDIVTLTDRLSGDGKLNAAGGVQTITE
ncbi:MAG: replicative DNA helicase, partial [Clostridia bacterium]|nr:replicative DNA helicase [Clostridia bacterium]